MKEAQSAKETKARTVVVIKAAAVCAAASDDEIERELVVLDFDALRDGAVRPRKKVRHAAPAIERTVILCGGGGMCACMHKCEARVRVRALSGWRCDFDSARLPPRGGVSMWIVMTSMLQKE